ncbi:MAG: hypothetical protein ACE5K7_06820 [Phycisphaerae bacterium]
MRICANPACRAPLRRAGRYCHRCGTAVDRPGCRHRTGASQRAAAEAGPGWLSSLIWGLLAMILVHWMGSGGCML